MRQITKQLIYVLMAIVAIESPAMSPAQGKSGKTLVEVWCGGDDGLTQRLRLSIEGEFASSPNFQMSKGKKPGTLVVTIPSNVPWRREGERTHVLYTVNYASSDGRDLGKSRGSCWDDDLVKCAIHIVTDAKVAARKIR